MIVAKGAICSSIVSESWGLQEKFRKQRFGLQLYSFDGGLKPNSRMAI